MSRFWGALGVLGIIAALTVSGFRINTGTAHQVLEKLENAYDLARDGDMDSARVQLETAQQIWDEKIETMLLFISHGRIDRIEEAIHQAYDYLDSRERSLFLAECSTAILQTEHLIHVEYPYVNNIF